MSSNRILYDSQESKHTRGRARLRTRTFLIIGFGILAVGLVIFGMLFASKRWVVTHIEVSGLETIDSGVVRERVAGLMGGAILGIIPRNTFFLVQPASILHSIATAMPEVQAESIEKKFPDTLILSLHERRPWGVLCARGVEPALCAYIDDHGFAYSDAPDFTGKLFVRVDTDAKELAIPAQIFSKELMATLSKIGKESARVLGVDHVNYQFSSDLPREIRVTTEEGFSIFFNREDDFTNAFRVLKTVLAEEIKDKRKKLDYIDLRFGNKVFYKLK